MVKRVHLLVVFPCVPIWHVKAPSFLVNIRSSPQLLLVPASRFKQQAEGITGSYAPGRLTVARNCQRPAVFLGEFYYSFNRPRLTFLSLHCPGSFRLRYPPPPPQDRSRQTNTSPDHHLPSSLEALVSKTSALLSLILLTAC